MALKLKVITGSTRPGRAGPTVADWVNRAARKHGGFEVEAIDLADFNLPLLDESTHPAAKKYEHEHTRRWSAAIDDADAFVFVTPEYDYLAPASLINAIQCLLKEWGYKAAGVVSYGGVSGGLRSAETLRHLLMNVGVMPIPGVVPIPFFTGFIGDDGVLEPNEQMEKGINGMFNELLKWSEALEPIRSNTA